MPKMLSNAATRSEFFFPEILYRPNYSGDEMSSEFLVWLLLESEKDFLTICQKALAGVESISCSTFPGGLQCEKEIFFSGPKLPSLKGRVGNKIREFDVSYICAFILLPSRRLSSDEKNDTKIIRLLWLRP